MYLRNILICLLNFSWKGVLPGMWGCLDTHVPTVCNLYMCSVKSKALLPMIDNLRGFGVCPYCAAHCAPCWSLTDIRKQIPVFTKMAISTQRHRAEQGMVGCRRPQTVLVTNWNKPSVLLVLAKLLEFSSSLGFFFYTGMFYCPCIPTN